MVRKPRPRLVPMRDLTNDEREERRLARRLGFTNENTYRNWVKSHSSLPKSDLHYFDPTTPSDRLAAKVKLLRGYDRKIKSGPKEIIKKSNVLLFGDEQKLSEARFWDSFGNQIREALANPKTSQRDKAQLRKLQRHIENEMSVPDWLKPGEQATLF